MIIKAYLGLCIILIAVMLVNYIILLIKPKSVSALGLSRKHNTIEDCKIVLAFLIFLGLVVSGISNIVTTITVYGSLDYYILTGLLTVLTFIVLIKLVPIETE